MFVYSGTKIARPAPKVVLSCGGEERERGGGGEGGGQGSIVKVVVPGYRVPGSPLTTEPMKLVTTVS